MPRRTGKMDGECYYCNKKMWIVGLVGGKVVCNYCYKNNEEFLFEKNHFYDALTIQVYWRLYKKIKPKYFDLWNSLKRFPQCAMEMTAYID